MCLHPRDHLPPEMWAEIFLHVKSPQDLYNLMEAHSFWAALLEPQLPHIQFQLAFPHLANLLEERTKNRTSTIAGTPYLSKEDLLNCRRVCKSWDEAVRTYYQGPSFYDAPFIDERNLTGSHFYGRGLTTTQVTRRGIAFRPEEILFPYDEENDDPDPDPVRYRTWLQSLFNSHPPQTNANPFFSRNWESTVDGEWEEDGDEMTMAVLNYVNIRDTLQAYGSHLRKWELDWDGAISFERFYSALREWLTFTPNLTSLMVVWDEQFHEPIHPFLEEMEEAELRNCIQAHPMPELPNLECLRLECLPPPVQNQLLERYHHHVKSLYLELSIWNREWEVFQPAPLENLRTLQLSILAEEDLHVFGRCLHPSWLQLQHLGVDFSQDDTTSWEQIITWLNQLFGEAPKLQKLFICAPNYEPSQEAAILRDTQRCRLQLRPVQQLKLRLMNPTILVDFLLPMKDSLQKMAIEFMSDDAQPGDFPPNRRVHLTQKILWNGYLGKKLLESNLWDTFPKLDFLRVESFNGWTYRRRMGQLPVFINPDGTEETVNKDSSQRKWRRGLNLRALV